MAGKIPGGRRDAISSTVPRRAVGLIEKVMGVGQPERVVVEGHRQGFYPQAHGVNVARAGSLQQRGQAAAEGIGRGPADVAGEEIELGLLPGNDAAGGRVQAREPCAGEG